MDLKEMIDLKKVEVRAKRAEERIRQEQALQQAESRLQEAEKALEEDNYNKKPIPFSASGLVAKKRKRSGEFNLSIATLFLKLQQMLKIFPSMSSTSIPTPH